MKPRSLILFLLPVAACTGTSEPPSPAPSAPPMTVAAPSPIPSPPTLTLSADVVTIDTAAPSVTLREGDAPAVKTPKASDIKKGDRTLKLEAAALAGLTGIKPGDRVSVTCRQMVAPVITGAAPSAASSPGAASSAGTLSSPAAASSAAPMATTGTGLELCEAIVAITKAAAASPAR